MNDQLRKSIYGYGQLNSIGKTVNISEIIKGKGALHCITAYLKRG